MAKTAKRNIRFDSHHVRLKTGESEKQKGGYEYRWTADDGKRHSVFASTLEKLRELEEQIIVDKHDSIKADVKGLTVNDCFNLWKDLKRGIRDNTLQNYIYMYEMFIMPSFGKKRVTQIVKSDVKRFYNTLKDERNLKISTMDTIHNVLRQTLQVAVDDNYIRFNPADNMLKELRVAHGDEIEKRRALSMPQQKLFFDYLLRTPQYRHWYPIFFIMTNTGMRPGELTGLRWDDVDFEENIVDVNHTVVYYKHRDELENYLSINPPKTKAGIREIPMIEEVRNAFAMEYEFQKEAGIKCVDRIDGYTNFIFLNRYGKVQREGTLNKALKRIIRDCNDEILLKVNIDSSPVLLPNFSCYNLRHTFATRLCEAAVNLKAIQSIMGHSDIVTTMNVYVDVMKETTQNAISVYNNYITAAQDYDCIQEKNVGSVDGSCIERAMSDYNRYMKSVA